MRIYRSKYATKRDPSRAGTIRRLLKKGHLSSLEIARVVGCADAYVRAVKQRTGPDGNFQETPALRGWRERNIKKIRRQVRARFYWRYWNEPGYREKRNAENRLRYARMKEAR